MDENVIFSDEFLMLWDVTEFFQHKISLLVAFSENYVGKEFLLQYKFETVGRSPFRYDKIQDYGGLGGGWWKMYRFFMQKRKEIPYS